MFTWICPKCGSEVPPSENECPACRARANTPTATVTTAAMDVPAASPGPVSSPTLPPLPTAGPRSVAPNQPVIEPLPPPQPFQSTHVSTHKTSSLSPMLVAACTAVGIVALLAILYLFVLPRGATSRNSGNLALESPAAAGTDAANAHPLAKYIEVTGLRVSEGGSGQAKISFVAVNHSPADLPELDTHLTLASNGTTVFEFPVVIPSIGPYESKDIASTVRTRLKPYELPDWQTLKPSLRIVAER